jgi:capsular exopolysaccharide synthesis family protein
MQEAPFSLDRRKEERPIILKDEVLKYLRFWPWFIMAAVFGIGLGYLYMRYAPIIWESVAKIEIIDASKEMDITSDALALLRGNSNINLDNDIEVLKSYRILRQVAEALNLDISYYKKGNIKTTEIWNPPFAITKLMAEDSIYNTRVYDIVLDASEATITDMTGEITTVYFNRSDTLVTGLPFSINMRANARPKNYENVEFRVVLNPIKTTVLNLAKNLMVEPSNKNAEILSLILQGESKERSETILNELINKFNQDGITDRQLVSKRTIDFIDERFADLSGELDSIEVGKEDFKRLNKLSYIESDANFSLERKAESEDEVSKLENQITLSGLLKNAVMGQSEYSLLPVNIGLENSGVNSLVSEYNLLAINREKLMTSVGENHPTFQSLSAQLERSKVNILKTINVYQTQLKLSLRQLDREKSQAGQSFSRLPEKEKMLRSIERQQSIKENLFLLLLQKREEAGINYAVTAPSIKIVDYALTGETPIAPKKKIVYGLSCLLGMFLPFMVLYLRFSLDNKIQNKSDIEKIHPDIPVLAEIPYIKGQQSFEEANDRSALAEAFRILSANMTYLLPKTLDTSGKVIYVTSSREGEGKSLLAYNLSLAFASLNKKVLLVGADLRKPQLNEYFHVGHDIKGLSDFLYDPGMNWMECIYQGNKSNKFHKVCFSGSIPINVPQLLAGDGMEQFLDLARKEFEYIIVDTAPTMLVADTLLISKYADLTLFVTRAGHTEKKTVEFSKELWETNRLQNMAYVVNDVATSKNKAYTYGYSEDKSRE